jgi:hypothetical protein
LVTLCLAACASAAATPSGSSAPATATPAPSIDPASLLAQRDGASDDSAYVSALDALGSLCTQDRVAVAGMADFGYNDLEKNGVKDETRLTVLHHLAESIPAGQKTDCQGVMAAYLVLRETPS